MDIVDIFQKLGFFKIIENVINLAQKNLQKRKTRGSMKFLILETSSREIQLEILQLT